MRKDKEHIFQLRREGKSYRQIQKETGVSRATLWAWFKDVEWSKHISEEHKTKNLGASRERMERMNMVRKLKLQYGYALVEKEAEEEYQKYRHEPLFWAGLMLYARGGDRKSKHYIRIAGGGAYIHRIFTLFAERYLPESVLVNRLQNSGSVSIISNTSLKRKVLKWLTLSEEETFKYS